MGTSPSKIIKETTARDILMNRKVTNDILENLANNLPTTENKLGKILKLKHQVIVKREKKENLNYLKDWKEEKKDDATIGSLVELLKTSGHKPEQYECLFNISREPKNASTTTDPQDFILRDTSTIETTLPNIETIFLPQESFNHESHDALVPVQRTHYANEHEDNTHRAHQWSDYRDWGKMVVYEQLNIGEYGPGVATTDNNIFLTDSKERKIHILSTEGKIMKSVSTGKLTPGGISLTNKETLAVGCGPVVALWSNEGEYLGEFGRGSFQSCRGVFVDCMERFIVTDIATNEVTIHTKHGNLITRLDNHGNNKFNKPYYVTMDHRNQILVSDNRNHCVKIFDKHGKYLNKFGNFGARRGELRSPLGVQTDCCGNIIICDYGNQRISMYSSGGWYLKEMIEKSETLGQPVAMATYGDRRLAVSSIGRLSIFDFAQNGEFPMLNYIS
ncbi:uncharacterized protein LOC144744503 [Ciona intestinalis]